MKLKLKDWVLSQTLHATSVAALDKVLDELPINADYVYDKTNPMKGWIAGQLHWVPVGLDPGNAGRIKLGNDPDNRIAERIVNMLEALIELARRGELKANPASPPPVSPRDAVLRYFNVPRLDLIPGLNDGKTTYQRARDLARRVRVRVSGAKGQRALIFEDDGIGQAPSRLHSTILSLGGDNKNKERYMIGMWGQGGSSAFAASQATWIVSRRAPQLGDAEDGIAWTAVREIEPTDDRRSYYAYLAASPAGEVPYVDASAAAGVGLEHGTRIGHLGFDFGTLDPFRLYQALNHVLPNPVLPFEIFTKTTNKPDLCWGMGYLLSRQSAAKKTDLDKPFHQIRVASKEHGE